VISELSNFVGLKNVTILETILKWLPKPRFVLPSSVLLVQTNVDQNPLTWSKIT